MIYAIFCPLGRTRSFLQRLAALKWTRVLDEADVSLLAFYYRCYQHDNLRNLQFASQTGGRTIRRPPLLSALRLGRKRRQHFANLAPQRGPILFNRFLTSQRFLLRNMDLP